ncbi:MAG: proteasome accessory factor PafA2 family protein [Gemmatimonadales bacterium]
MLAMLMGAETEYAIAGLDHVGRGLDLSGAAQALVGEARRHRYLPSMRGSALFLENGGCFYVDRGNHPEYATPECRDPWQLARYVRAGDLFLEGLAAEVMARHPTIRQLTVHRANVHYRAPDAVWGSHESYLSRLDPREIGSHLVPHLVSRIVFAGAGGFVPGPTGLLFTLSPRAWSLGKEMSGGSTHERGIVHLRDETLSRGPYHRIHVIAGESLCSERAAVLRYGSTALVVAAANLGADPTAGLALADSVGALRTIAADPTCRATVELDRTGERLTAVEIQRRILGRIEGALGGLPGWAVPLAELWRAELDRIERAAPDLHLSLDWALKLELFRRRAEGRLSWEAVQRWAARGERTEAKGPRGSGPLMASLPFERLVALAQGGEQAKVADSLVRPAAHAVLMLEALTECGLAADDLAALGALRAKLHEIDFRFGQLGGEGIYQQLAGAGLVAGAGLGEVDAAICTPPPDTRARFRGEAVTHLGANPGALGSSAEWTHVRRKPDGRVLDLRDPFPGEPIWEDPGVTIEPMPTGDGLQLTLPEFIRRHTRRSGQAAADRPPSLSEPGT